MARKLQFNLDGRDAHHLQVALGDLEHKLYQRSANSPEHKEHWRQVRDLQLRVGRSMLRQQAADMGLAEANR